MALLKINNPIPMSANISPDMNPVYIMHESEKRRKIRGVE